MLSPEVTGNPNSHTFTSLPSSFINLIKHSSKMIRCTLLVLGLAFILYFMFGIVLAQVSSSTWTVEVSLPVAVQEVSVAALNNQVYVVGGSTSQARSNTVYVFNPTSHTWTNPTNYPDAARDHIGSASLGGKLYIVGGLTGWPGPSVATVQMYDSASNTWTSVAPLPVARGAMGVTALNGKIYAAGGLVNGSAVTDFTVYDPATNTWAALPAMPTARDHLVAVALNGLLYAIGGRAGSNAICAPMTTVEVYNPSTNTWSTSAPLAVARGGHAAGTLNGRIQVFGGEGSAGSCGVIASAEEYDPGTNTWSALPSMPTPRHGTGGATIGSSIYIPGGGIGSGDAPTSIHERFDQSSNPPPFAEQNGQVVVEAENYHTAISRGGKSWVNHADRIGFVGSGAMVAEPDTGSMINTGYTTNSPELQYQVQFSTPGTYYVWVRALPDDDNNNSVHVGIDGQAVASSDQISTTNYGAWTWIQGTLDGPVATISVPSAGVHTINVWMREDGFRADRLLLTTNGSYIPTNAGPAESPRSGSSPSPTPTPTPPASGGQKLAGTAFGTTPAWAAGSEYDKAFDANPNTFFDFAQADGGYTGIDLGAGAARVVSKIRFYPRSGFAARMTGGKFQGSNLSTNSGFVDLYTVSSTPAEAAYTEVAISDQNSYRYLRYMSASGSYGNVAEVEFYSSQPSPTPTPTPIPTPTPTPTPIPGSVSMTDDFNDNTRDTTKWYLGTLSDGATNNNSLVTVLEQNQRLEITPRTNISNWNYNGYVSRNTFDFTSGRASVEVVQAPNSASFADLTFAVYADSNNWYRFVIENGWLRFDDKVAGTKNLANKILYNLTQHRFLRIRHDQPSDTIYWETSADNVTWVVQRSVARSIPITALQMELNGGTYQPETAPGTIIFDNFRVDAKSTVKVNQIPIANAGGRYNGTVGQSIQFNSNGSTDPDGTITAYRWDFGDGTTGTGATPTHAYSSANYYPVTLTVTDNSNATNTVSTTATITAPATQTDPSIVGQWSNIISWPLVAVHMTVLPNGNIMSWDHAINTLPIPIIWDPVANNNTFTQVPIMNNQNGTRRDSIYCSGHSFLPDGRLFVTGGHVEPRPDDVVGSKFTNIFDYSTNKWSNGPDMNDGRWYPTNTTLGNGATLVVSGSIDGSDSVQAEGYAYRVNQLPQVYETSGQFRDLSSALLVLPLYPFMYQAPNGKVFNAGPNQLTRYLDTSGTGTWTTVGNSNFGFRLYGSSVMYDDGKVLIVGGTATQDASTPSTATAEVIDLNQPSPAWRYVSSMAHPRHEVTATILPDGKVLATGGTMSPNFSVGYGAVLPAEIWDPATEKWTTVASMHEARLHHSTAALLPDGRVLIGGGGEPTGDGDYDHKTVEFYSPPYLFKGARPTITSAPANVSYGQTFSVSTPNASGIAQVTMIRLSSDTHSFNQNQRINHLSFSQTAGGLNVTAPANGNLCPPGHYMLFILNSSGVPSVAKIIQIGNSGPATPTNLAAASVSPSQINLSWTDTATNEDGFKIERSLDGTTFTQVATVAANTTTYSDTGLAASTTYYYRVRAYNTGGDSGYSNTAQATTLTLSQTPPTAPSGLVGASVSASQIDLTWVDNSNNESGFKIERSTDGTNFTEIASVSANTTSYSSTGLTSATFYYYRVRAYNSAGNSAYSNVVKVRTKSR